MTQSETDLHNHEEEDYDNDDVIDAAIPDGCHENRRHSIEIMNRRATFRIGSLSTLEDDEQMSS